MKAILRWLPQTLVGRVFTLYSISLFIFVLTGLGFFYYHQFNKAIDEAYESASLLTEVIAPTITDSAVIGDYDTVKRTLEKVLFRSAFYSASFIDVRGGIVSKLSTREESVEAPSWLHVLVLRRLSDINRNISAGGRDYGVLRLKFSPEHIAADIWVVTRSALFIAAACFFLGIALIRIPLRSWLGNLDRMRAFEWEFQSGSAKPQDLLSNDAPIEIRQTFDILNRTAASLQLQRARADVTLGAIADGVITADTQGNIVYANPVAARLFHGDPQALLGRNLKATLPPEVTAVLEDLQGTGRSNRRVELGARTDTRRILDCSWTPICEPSGKTAGHVLAYRDVTEAHLLEIKLRHELESRKAALDSLHDVVKGLQKDDDLRVVSSDDISAVSRFIGELSRERERVTALLENSVRELGYQKFALDEHSIVSITDAAGNITYANDKFSEISGYRADELLGQNHHIIKSGLHSAQFYKDIWETISSGKVWHGQIANRNKNGAIYWTASSIVPWLDSNGLPYQYVAIRTDITEQKNVEHALEEARRRELEIGTSIQRSLLQDEVPEDMEGAWLACFTEPSQGIDGDFYAIRNYHPGCFEVLVGDVMGKGVPAALIGAAIKTAYNEVLADLLGARLGDSRLPTPAEIINQLHRRLTPRLISLDSFATLALYRFDQQAGTLTYVNAGHTPGLLTCGDDRKVVAIVGDNLPIGIIAEEVYVQLTVTVQPGDSLLVFSDGITEARNGNAMEFGIESLSGLVEAGCKAALPPATILHCIRQQLRRFVGGNQLSDDQTALMVQLHPPSAQVRKSPAMGMDTVLFNLAWNLASMTQLRIRIKEAASSMPEEDAEALILASHEAATNIVRHAPATISDPTLVCRIQHMGNDLVVELIYPGEAFTPPDNNQPDFSGNSEGGFGLFIIEESVDRVEYVSPVPGIGIIRLVKHFQPPLECNHGTR